MPDGDIQLSVGITTQDIRNKASELRDTVQKMLDANVGNKLDSSLKQIMTQMGKLATESSKLEAQMHNIDNAYLGNLNSQIENLRANISETEKMLNSAPKFAQGGAEFTEQQQHLEAMQTELAKLLEQKQAVETQGVGLGWSTEYDQASSKMNNLNNQLVILKARLDEARGGNTNIGGKIADSSDKATGSVSRLGEAVRGAFAYMNSHIGSSEKQINKLASSVGGRLVSSFNKVKTATERAFSAKNIKRGLVTLIKYTVGVRSLYFLFRKLRNAVKEGLQNLVQYHSSTNATNKAMTELRSSLLFLKNAWASAFAPIINFVMPALTMLIDGIAEVGNAIARFIGALTGQSNVLNAVKVNAGDYAKSLDKVGGSAKKAKDRLASFDDLNVLGKDSDAGGGGGASSLTPDPNEMFEYVDAVSDLADLIKEAWASADFTKVGAVFKDKIISALQSINWEDVYAQAEKIGKSAGTFLYGLFGDPELWAEAGTAIAGGLNTITYGLKAFLDETAKIDFGGNFATFINEFVKNTDWSTAGANINSFFTQITDNIQSFFDTLDTDELSTAIVEFAEGLDLPDLVLKLTDCVISISDGVIELGADLIAKFGQQLGENLVIYVNKDRNIVFTDAGEKIVIPYEVDWTEDPTGSLANTLLFDIGKWGLDKLNIDVTADNVSALNDAVYNLLSNLEKILEVFLFFSPAQIVVWVMEIITHLDEINQFITDITSNMDGVITSIDFLLNMAEMIWTISHGLLGWLIYAGMSPELFSSLLDDITNKLVEFVFGALALGQQLEDGFKEFTGNIATGLSETWENISISASEKWRAIKEGITGRVIELKESVVSKFVEIKDNIIGKILMLKDNAIQKFMEIRAGIYNAFSTLSTLIKSPINAVIGVVESFVNKIIKGINKLIGSFDGIGDLASQVGLTVPELKIPEISIPRLAQGAVIPPNKEFMAVLGDQSHGTNIEAPLDTIKQAVAEVMGANGNQEVVQLLQQLITVVENKNLTIGDKEIGKANARYTNQQRMIRGTSF